MEIDDIMKNWGLDGKGEDVIPLNKRIRRKIKSIDKYLGTNYKDIQAKEKGEIRKIVNIIRLKSSDITLTTSLSTALNYLISQRIPMYDIITAVLEIPKEVIEERYNISLDVVDYLPINNDIPTEEEKKVKLMIIYVYILMMDKYEYVKDLKIAKNVRSEIYKFLGSDDIYHYDEYIITFLEEFASSIIRIAKQSVNPPKKQIKKVNNKGESASLKEDIYKYDSYNMNPSMTSIKIAYEYLLYLLEEYEIEKIIFKEK